MNLRVLVGPETDDLTELYDMPRAPWLRVNMVSTLDGAATGESGKTGSINNPADHRVFHHLRSVADAIVVGAGTARVEGYGPTDRPIVVVSRRGEVPQTLRGAPPGSVLLATCADSTGLDEAKDLLGEDHVLALGREQVDLVRLREALVERGWTRLLSEGGPHLLRDMLAAGVVDELCVTFVPRVVAGLHPQITQGPAVDVPLSLHTLLESDGTLLGRWFVTRPADDDRGAEVSAGT